MPRYTYVAKTDPAKTTQGFIEAENEQDAINKLTTMGLFPLSVSYETPDLENQNFFGFRRVSARDIAQLTRQLSTLLDSGINILKALTIVSGQTANKSLAVILNDIGGRIRDGKSFSDGLGSFPALFSKMYCAMVHTGEASGDLNAVMKRMADFLDEQEEFRNSLKASLTYPLFVVLVSVLTVVVLLAFVIPRLVTMFEDMGQALPVPTQILIQTSTLLRQYWWVLVLGLGISGFVLRRAYLTPPGRMFWDRFSLGLPVAGTIAMKSEVARLMRTLSLLLASGIPITPALDISGAILENRALQQEVAVFRNQISSGSSLSDTFGKSKLFPAMVTNIISIGEETGSLDKSLMRIAAEYETEVNRTLKELTRLVEPLIILVMGLIVGFIVLSMLLPIFQINLIAR